MAGEGGLIQNAGTCEYIHVMLPTFLSLILKLFNDAATKSELIKDVNCTRGRKLLARIKICKDEDVEHFYILTQKFKRNYAGKQKKHPWIKSGGTL